jgi:two-component system response regulator AgrA
MLKIIIVEDNIKHLEMLSSYIQSYLIKNNMEGCMLLETGNPADVLDYIKSENNIPNVFFIDIDLKTTINGVELAKEIKQLLNKAYIIFITNHIKYQQSAFRIHAYDYLPKPVVKDCLNKCLRDIHNELIDMVFVNGPEEGRVVIKSGYREFYIKKQEILYIEKQCNKALINTVKSQYSCYLPLEHFEKLFENDSNFTRCHKSFLVNRDFIKELRFNKLEVELITGKVCFMSRKYKRGLKI